MLSRYGILFENICIAEKKKTQNYRGNTDKIKSEKSKLKKYVKT